MVSPTAIASMNAASTSEVYLTLLSITHPSIHVPLNFVNDVLPVTSNTIDFVAWPFKLPFPEVGSDVLPTLTLSIDNIDRSIWKAIQGISDPLTVTIYWVLRSDPNTIEGGPISMRMRTAKADMTTIQGTLIFEDLLNEPYPYETFTPGTAPGLF